MSQVVRTRKLSKRELYAVVAILDSVQELVA